MTPDHARLRADRAVQSATAALNEAQKRRAELGDRLRAAQERQAELTRERHTATVTGAAVGTLDADLTSAERDAQAFGAALQDAETAVDAAQQELATTCDRAQVITEVADRCDAWEVVLDEAAPLMLQLAEIGEHVEALLEGQRHQDGPWWLQKSPKAARQWQESTGSRSRQAHVDARDHALDRLADLVAEL